MIKKAHGCHSMLQVCKLGFTLRSVLVYVLVSNLQKEETLCCLLDQFIGDILRVKLGSEFNQQRVVPLHILGCHLGLASHSREMPE